MQENPPDSPKAQQLVRTRTLDQSEAGAFKFIREEDNLSQDEKELEDRSLFYRQYAPLIPFRIYGRSNRVPVLNLTGILSNHVVFAASNYVVIWNFIKDQQIILPGHKNSISTIQYNTKDQFVASGDLGPNSSVILWNIFNGLPLQIINIEEGHPENNGIVNLAFAEQSGTVGLLGAEKQIPQVVSLWQLGNNLQSASLLSTVQVPVKAGFQHSVQFHGIKSGFFSTTGAKAVVFYTWNENEKSISTHVPKIPSRLGKSFNKFAVSIWDEDTDKLLTSTMSGFIVLWSARQALGMELPPDPSKNIPEFERSFKLSTCGITAMQKHQSYLVTGDEQGVISFFNESFHLLHTVRVEGKQEILSLAFNRLPPGTIPSFQKAMRDRYEPESGIHVHTEKHSSIKDYTIGSTFGTAQPKETSLEANPFDAQDFFVCVKGGSLGYYHLAENRMDVVIQEGKAHISACDVNPVTQHLAVVTSKGEAILYDSQSHRVISKQLLFKEPQHCATCLKIHPSGAYIFIGTTAGKILPRHAMDWSKVKEITLHNASLAITNLQFADSGTFLASSDKSNAISLHHFSLKSIYVYVGKQKAHLGDLVDLVFYFDPKTSRHRFFSLGNDRKVIEYDLSKRAMAKPEGLLVLSITEVEQMAIPVTMTVGNPFGMEKPQLLIANDAGKITVYDPDDRLVRRTCQGPGFGLVNKMEVQVCRTSDDQHHDVFTFIASGNKLGLITPPIDGDPTKYMAVLGHPTRIKDIVSLKDSNFVFTIGESERVVVQWLTNFHAAVTERINGLNEPSPFMQLLDTQVPGGLSLAEECFTCFCMLNMQRSKNVNEFLKSEAEIPVSEIPAVLRFCGYFPTEYEIKLMTEEAEYMGVIDHGDRNTYITYEDFVRLFANHRKYPHDRRLAYESAAQQLVSAKGYEESQILQGITFQKLMLKKGERMKGSELKRLAPQLFPSASMIDDAESERPLFMPVGKFGASEISERVDMVDLLDTYYSKNVPKPLQWSLTKIPEDEEMEFVLDLLAEKKRQRLKLLPACGTFSKG